MKVLVGGWRWMMVDYGVRWFIMVDEGVRFMMVDEGLWWFMMVGDGL